VLSVDIGDLERAHGLCSRLQRLARRRTWLLARRTIMIFHGGLKIATSSHINMSAKPCCNFGRKGCEDIPLEGVCDLQSKANMTGSIL